MNCRDEILECVARLTKARSDPVFDVAEVRDYMMRRGTSYESDTITTHVCSRMCKTAPDNHGTTYADFERVGRGRYRWIAR